MVRALIIAGGVGSRLGENIPKQYIEVNNKPIIIYTLETFQNNPSVEEIYLVCADVWKEEVIHYIDTFKITKLKKIFSAGDNAQMSICNGVIGLEKIMAKDDFLIIHDGVRPMLEPFILDDVIEKANVYLNAASSLPYNEQIFIKDDELCTSSYIPRETLRRVVTPQCYKYGDILGAYKFALKNNVELTNSSYANTLITKYGKKLYFSAGSDMNFKITTKIDLEMFKFLKSRS